MEYWGMDTFKKSPIGKFLQNTFGEVAVKYNSANAEIMRKSIKEGKMDFSGFKKIGAEPDKQVPTLSTGEGVSKIGLLDQWLV